MRERVTEISYPKNISHPSGTWVSVKVYSSIHMKFIIVWHPCSVGRNGTKYFQNVLFHFSNEGRHKKTNPKQNFYYSFIFILTSPLLALAFSLSLSVYIYLAGCHFYSEITISEFFFENFRASTKFTKGQFIVFTLIKSYVPSHSLVVARFFF